MMTRDLHDNLTEGEGDEIALLGRCLSFDGAVESLSALRIELLSNPERWGAVIEAARDRLLLSALAHQLDRRGLVPPAGAANRPGSLSVPDFFAETAASYGARRDRMAEGLFIVVGALNDAGIEPILLKGAVSLWTGAPQWRFLRDLDILIQPHESDRAFDALLASGFVPTEDGVETTYHLSGLAHPDMPGWVELHFGASSIHGEDLMPTAELRAASTVADWNGARAGFAPLPQRMLHALIHHHFHHHGGLYGIIHVNGLFEFAWGLGELTGDEAAFLADRSRRDPLLAAAVDLWLAAAVDLFGATLPPGLKLHEDAMARWSRVRARLGRNAVCSYTRAYLESSRMALARARVSDAARKSEQSTLAIAARALVRPLWRALDAPHFVDKRENVLKSAGIVRSDET